MYTVVGTTDIHDAKQSVSLFGHITTLEYFFKNGSTTYVQNRIYLGLVIVFYKLNQYLH